MCREPSARLNDFQITALSRQRFQFREDSQSVAYTTRCRRSSSLSK